MITAKSSSRHKYVLEDSNGASAGFISEDEMELVSEEAYSVNPSNESNISTNPAITFASMADALRQMSSAKLRDDMEKDRRECLKKILSGQKKCPDDEREAS